MDQIRESKVRREDTANVDQVPNKWCLPEGSGNPAVISSYNATKSLTTPVDGQQQHNA